MIVQEKAVTFLTNHPLCLNLCKNTISHLIFDYYVPKNAVKVSRATKFKQNYFFYIYRKHIKQTDGQFANKTLRILLER